MTRKTSSRKRPRTKRFVVRYNSKQDYGLVVRAARLENMSINSWLMRLSLAAAKRRVNKAESEAQVELVNRTEAAA